MPVAELDDWHKQVLKPVEDIPHTVAHELIHLQQKSPKQENTLLARAIGEGRADFIGELMTPLPVKAVVANASEAFLVSSAV